MNWSAVLNELSPGADDARARGIRWGLGPLQLLAAGPSVLFVVALGAMLLRHPDVSFYEIDRVFFVLLFLGVAGHVLLTKRRVSLGRVGYPMIGLTLFSVASTIGQPFDQQTWSLLSAKFVVPFSLFYLAKIVFVGERRLRQFEWFALAVLAYLSFTSIAFLVGAKSLIYPRFILDESLGYHADRARGPLLQAVANGVSLNLLGLLAVHAFLRGRIRGLAALALLGALPVAILATMTRAVWLSFTVSVGTLILRSSHRRLRRIAVAVAAMGLIAVGVTLSFDEQRVALSDRLEESGPVDFREAVYAASWQMFLERPFNGWGVNRMPAELALHVSGFRQKELYPHNTYLELLVEHGVFGLALYAWLIWELFKLGRGRPCGNERGGFLNRDFHQMWPILLGVYLVNASVVVMNYQFVNGLLFSMGGMLAAQQAGCIDTHRTVVSEG